MTNLKYPPLTVEDAVDYLQVNMSPNFEIPLSTMKKEDLGDLYFSLGAFAKDILGLWSGNDELMETCGRALGKKVIDADDASMLIIELLWERLQKQEDMGSIMPAQLEVKKPVSIEALLISEMIQSEALINLLDRKGIIGKQELQDEIRVLKEKE